MNVLADRFSDLSDPREDGKVIYPLTDILVIAGAESYEDIVLYGESKTSWLGEFLDLEHGIPSHDTFRRGFGLIEAEAFEACFTRWAESQSESSPDGELVTIDGMGRKAEDESLKDAARRHSSLENSLHGVLDVTFGEDQSRVRDETAAVGWAVFGKWP